MGKSSPIEIPMMLTYGSRITHRDMHIFFEWRWPQACRLVRLGYQYRVLPSGFGGKPFSESVKWCILIRRGYGATAVSTGGMLTMPNTKPCGRYRAYLFIS